MSVEILTGVERGDGVFDARGFSVAVSDDGKNFTAVASEDYPVATPDSPNGVLAHKLTFEPRNARYLKVVALSERRIPDWHTGKGYTGFLFVDEIVVERFLFHFMRDRAAKGNLLPCLLESGLGGNQQEEAIGIA